MSASSIGFDINRIAAKMSSFRFSVNDYEVVTPSLAKVVLNMSGMPDGPLEIRAAIAKLFKNQASAVEGSFRWATRQGDIKTAVGYVRAHNDVREYEEQAAAGKYRVMSSNLLMDNEDRSLWEVRDGAGSKYLCRQGNEDLTALVHMATAHKASLPSLVQLASGQPAPKDFVAFVDAQTEEVRYGFAVAAAAEGKVSVVATDDESLVEVSEALVIDVYELEKAEHARLSATAAADGLSREAMVEYYKKAYSYSPEYIQEIIKMIDQHAFA